jgi:ABC-type dipeptide/oligopeptide/nickel transport system permease subunit
VLRFYLACLWAAAPLVFVAALAWALPRVGRYLVPRYGFVAWLIIFAIVGYVVYSAATYPFGPDARTYRTLSSRLGLSFFGPLYVGVAVLGCVVIVGWVFGLLTGRIWGRSDEIKPDVE